MTPPPDTGSVADQRRPIALANPRSGAGSGVDPAVAEWCEHHGIELREFGDDFEADLRRAADERPRFVAVHGGDGTQRLAATVLSEAGIDLLPLPGGSFNHFARTLGLEGLDAAGRAVTSGAVETLPLPSIADHVFLNTAAVGWYPNMVRTRERLRQRMPRPFAAAAAFAAHLPRMHRLRVQIQGPAASTEKLVWLAWIGNGRFGMTAEDLTERRNVDDPVLDVRLLGADRRLPRVRLVGDLLFGRLRASAGMERAIITKPITLTSTSPTPPGRSTPRWWNSHFRPRSCPPPARCGCESRSSPLR